MTQRKKWLLSETALGDLRDATPEVVVIPFGATEPHGMHLPYATDVYETQAIADHACELSHNRGCRVVALPVIPFGVQTTHDKFPLSINLYPSTLNRILSDLTEVLDRSGVRKAVILNGHGGNDFYGHIKELYGQRHVFLTQVNWYQLCQDLAGKLFAGGGDHANEMETSLMLYLQRQLVDMQAAGDQPMSVPRLAAMRAGWARSPRPWDRFTEDSGAGDPRAATAAKGEQYFAAVCRELADFFCELAAAELDERFPFE